MAVKKSDVESYTKRRIEHLINTTNDGMRKAALANLRRGVGKKPGELPELWGEFLADMPEDMFGKSEPSAAEYAVYTALTLFALHQQGHELPSDAMHHDGVSLGQAAARLIVGEADAESAFDHVRRRFNMTALSTDIDEFAHHLRGLVQLLRAKAVPLDYARLAGEIYLYQNIDLRSDIRLNWGRDLYHEFYTLTHNGKDDKNEKE